MSKHSSAPGPPMAGVHKVLERVDLVSERLSHRLGETELRTTAALNKVTAALDGLRNLLHDPFDLRRRIERCEADIRELRRLR